MTMPVTTFAGQRVAVFGLARSGISTALSLKAGGAEVACWDDGAASRAAAVDAGLPLVDLTAADWSGFAALVLAPGVPLTHPKPHWTVDKAKAAGVEIIGDVELFFRERAKVAAGSPVVAITGTNGKSTTTALTAHVLGHMGFDVQMGGNIGVGVLSLAPPAFNRVHVLELSSFQIDLTPSLAPSVGLLLNITPDHLDRHGTLDHYAAIKARLVDGSEQPIVGMGDDHCRAIAAGYRARHRDVWRIGPAPTQTLPERPFDIGWEGGALMRGGGHGMPGPIATGLDVGGVGSLRGAHNMQNAAAAYAAVSALGLLASDGRWPEIDRVFGADASYLPRLNAAFRSFPGLAHRMEQLGHVGRVLVINDSKATNADSTEKALASFARDIFWIAGGTPKEGGIAPLADYFPRVSKAYLVGVCAPDFAKTLDGRVAYELCGTLDVALAAAVRDAAASAATEPVVLLSPACASYDQYKSFEHRGEHFRVLAKGLAGFVGV